MPCLCLLGEVLGKEAGVSVMEFDNVFLGPLVSVAPALVFWIAVIVLAAIMLRRGGGRAERFLVAGGGLKIIGNLLSIPTVAIVPWLVVRGYSMDSAVSLVEYYGIFLNVISMVGIICLVYAFWVKFKSRNFEGT